MDKFDYLGRVMTAGFPHCEGLFSPLWLVIWFDIVFLNNLLTSYLSSIDKLNKSVIMLEATNGVLKILLGLY